MNGRFGRLALALVFSVTLAQSAPAETVAETVRKWGLIGPWSLDCSQNPDTDQGAVLDYEIAGDGRVMHRRNFGDITDEGEVISADISGDGLLHLRVYFQKLKQSREYGLRMQSDGTFRAMYNRNQKGEYTIRDGKFSANGNPTPPQHRCR